MGEPLPKPPTVTPPIEETKDRKHTELKHRKCYGCRRRVGAAPDRNVTEEEKEKAKGNPAMLKRILTRRIPYTKSPPCPYCSKAYCKDCIDDHLATHGLKLSTKTIM